MTKAIDICDDHISWPSPVITEDMEMQMEKICERFAVKVQSWEGNNDKPMSVCYFAPSIPDDLADEFMEFVVAL